MPDQALVDVDEHRGRRLRRQRNRPRKREVVVRVAVGDGRTVERQGEPFLQSEYERKSVELFAALDETNPIRKAVRDGEDLESLITRPLDVADIEGKINERRRQRDRVETELEQSRKASAKRSEIESEIANLENELDELREERDSLTVDNNAPGHEELSNVRAERNRVQDRIERLESTLERIDENLVEKREERRDITIEPTDSIEEKLESVREEYHRAKQDADLLEEVYNANRRMFESGRYKELLEVNHDLLEDTVECWVCSSEVGKTELGDTLEQLQERVTEYQSRVEKYENQLDEYESRIEEIESARAKKQSLDREIADLEDQRASREESLEMAENELENLTTKIDQLEQSVETKTETVTNLESEIKYTKTRVEELEDEREELRKKADRKDTLQSQYESLSEEIRELRSRKEKIVRETRESFKTRIDELISRLETGFESARLTGSFELVVAREGRETSLDALSQGERELLGIIVGIAGYEAFDVANIAPILLLDNLGVLTDTNVNIMINYLKKMTDILVFTSYPDHDAFSGHEIDVSDWRVVSERIEDEPNSAI
ncbi:MAG: archaea-specific SMC-related protein [Halobacteriales archaeon]